MALENQSNLNFEVKGRKVFLVVECHTQTQQLDEKTILSSFQQSKYKNCSPQLDFLPEFIVKTNSLIIDVQQHKDKRQSASIHIATALDVSITFDIADDLMSATANVITAQGGKRLSMAVIKRACLENSIHFGLKTTLVKRLLKNVKGAPAGTEVIQLLVKGKPACNGIDASLKPKVNMFSDQVRQHRVNADGTFNLRDLGELETVKKGQIVAYKTQLTLGIDGKDIQGNVVQAQAGKDFVLKPTQGTAISKNNPNCLVATSEGLLRKVGEKIVVDDIYLVPKLTAKEGHINFHGSVIVEGDVSPDMCIDAKGDVIIGGFVESAKIRCHGNLTIKGGCVGHLNNNRFVNKNAKIESAKYSCELVAGQSINVDFASQTSFTAKFDCAINKYLTNCDVIARNLTVGELKKPMGKVIGGHFVLSQLMSAGWLGSVKSNIPININMNRVYDVFLVKEKELRDWIDVLEQRVGKLRNKILLLDNKDIKQKDIENQKLLILVTKVKKYIYFRRVLVQKRNEYVENISVNANRQLCRNITVKIADKSITSDEVKSASVFKMEAIGVTIEPQ